MIRGFYTAGSGMVTQSRRLDVIGDNMANARTAGFKKDHAVATTFSERILEGNLGTISLGRTIDKVSTNFSQGTVEESGNPFDLAIEGEGFFALEQADGTAMYTRNGKFALDSEGYLVSTGGGRLMGENGTIKVDSSEFTVSADGTVSVDGKKIDKITIYNPESTENMTKQSAGLFTDVAGTQKPFAGQIKQGAIESSNTDMMQEMIDMMGSQRSFQACSQIVKMIDSTLAKTVELGRMS